MSNRIVQVRNWNLDSQLKCTNQKIQFCATNQREFDKKRTSDKCIMENTRKHDMKFDELRQQRSGSKNTLQYCTNL